MVFFVKKYQMNHYELDGYYYISSLCSKIKFTRQKRSKGYNWVEISNIENKNNSKIESVKS